MILCYKTVLGTTIIKNMPSTPHSHTHTHTNREKTADQPEKALCACVCMVENMRGFYIKVL